MKNDSLKIVLIVAIIAIAGYFLYTNFAKTDAGQQGAVISGSAPVIKDPSQKICEWSSMQVGIFKQKDGTCEFRTDYTCKGGGHMYTTTTGACPTGMAFDANGNQIMNTTKK